MSKEDQEICARAAHAVGLECAGVDLMKDPDGKTYVIEVNGNYGYHVQDITKTDISTPLIEFCERNYKNGNKANNKSIFSLMFGVDAFSLLNGIKPVEPGKIRKPEPVSKFSKQDDETLSTINNAIQMYNKYNLID